MWAHLDGMTYLPRPTNIDWEDGDIPDFDSDVGYFPLFDSDFADEYANDDDEYFHPLPVYLRPFRTEFEAITEVLIEQRLLGDNWRAEARVERILREWNLWHERNGREDPAKGKQERVPDHFTKPKKPKRERPLKVEGLSAYDPTHGCTKRAEGRRKKQFKNKGRAGASGGKKNCNVVR